MKILLCSYFKFPRGDAGSIRHEKLAYMVKTLGNEAVVVGLGNYCGFEIKEFDNIKYTSFREKNSNILGKIQTRVRYWVRLKEFIMKYQPDLIIMDDLRPRVTVSIKRYCKIHKIKLIHDSVEWYSPEQFRLGALSLACVNKNILNRVLINKSMKVIAISSYLYEFYNSKGIKSVNIPIVLSDHDYSSSKTIHKKVQFMYAGQIGRKDDLYIVIEAFYRLSYDYKEKFKFHIVGCTSEQLIEAGIPTEYIEYLGECIEIHGRLKHEEVLEMMSCIDFTVLMRPPELRYSKAGFPTKVAESLSRSTPIVANITSDLNQYLVNGYNSLIVEEYTVEALMNTIQIAITLPIETRENMCRNAFNTAHQKLHYRNFLYEMKEVLK